MKRNRTAGIAFAAAIVLGLVLAGCGSGYSNTQASAGQGKAAAAKAPEQGGEPVKVHIALNGGLSPLIIAQEKGWLDEAFKSHHAEAVWSKFTSGPPLLESLVSGRVDLSWLGDGAAISGVANKLPFEVIGLISEGRDLNTILVPTGSPIATVENLKGKTVGAAKGTTSHVFLIKVLQAAGLTQQDVKIINLQFDDGQAAFEAGKLDAWVTIDPYVTLNVQQKKASVLDVKTEIYAPVSMIAHTEFAKEHPDLVVEFLKQYDKAVKWQNDNLDEAAGLYAAQTKIPAGIIKQVLSRSATRLSAYTPESLQAQEESAGILLQNQFLKQKADFKSAINDSFVIEALK